MSGSIENNDENQHTCMRAIVETTRNLWFDIPEGVEEIRSSLEQLPHCLNLKNCVRILVEPRGTCRCMCISCANEYGSLGNMRTWYDFVLGCDGPRDSTVYLGKPLSREKFTRWVDFELSFKIPDSDEKDSKWDKDTKTYLHRVGQVLRNASVRALINKGACTTTVPVLAYSDDARYSVNLVTVQQGAVILLRTGVYRQERSCCTKFMVDRYERNPNISMEDNMKRLHYRFFPTMPNDTQGPLVDLSKQSSIPAEHMLAFLMGTHARLGSESPVSTMNQMEPLREIYEDTGLVSYNEARRTILRQALGIPDNDPVANELFSKMEAGTVIKKENPDDEDTSSEEYESNSDVEYASSEEYES